MVAVSRLTVICDHGRDWDEWVPVEAAALSLRAGSNRHDRGGAVHGVEQVIPHGLYDQDVYDYDIALLKVGRLWRPDSLCSFLCFCIFFLLLPLFISFSRSRPFSTSFRSFSRSLTFFLYFFSSLLLPLLFLPFCLSLYLAFLIF